MYEISEWELRRLRDDKIEDALRRAEQDQFVQAYGSPAHFAHERWLAALLLAASVAIAILWQLAG